MYWIIVTGMVGTLSFILWCLNQPIPHNFSQPSTLRKILAFNTAYAVYFKILEQLGIRTRADSVRQMMDKVKHVNKVDLTGLEVEDTVFDGVRVRIYRPVEDGSASLGRPAMVYYHGGGWVVGDPQFFDISMAEIARALNMVIVSVDYRLAPEHPFPAPFDDSVVAAKYFLTHTSEYGVNARRIVIGGDSAGGTLAVAVSLKLRNEQYLIRPCRMLLIHPALQAMDFRTPSMIQNKSGPYLDRATMAWFWSLYICGSDKYQSIFERNLHTPIEIKKTLARTYLDHSKLAQDIIQSPYSPQELYGGDDDVWNELKDTLTNPYLAPLLAEDLSGLPSAYMFTAGADVLRDDCLHFVRRLQEAGGKVDHFHMQRGMHGLNVFTHVFQEGRELLDDIIRDLKQNV